MFSAWISGIRFMWRATAGYRLRPWRSPYLRWRLETYSGKPAHAIRLRDFFLLLWSERRQVGRFAGWLGEMEHLGADQSR